MNSYFKYLFRYLKQSSCSPFMMYSHKCFPLYFLSLEFCTDGVLNERVQCLMMKGPIGGGSLGRVINEGD